jgi:ABC-type xylose transport system permease subunit
MEPAGEFPLLNEMPENVRKASGMSLWNLCLEIHTGRIFGGITGGFYILIVPLAGITGIIVVLSGYMVWRRKYKIKK